MAFSIHIVYTEGHDLTDNDAITDHFFFIIIIIIRFALFPGRYSEKEKKQNDLLTRSCHSFGCP